MAPSLLPGCIVTRPEEVESALARNIEQAQTPADHEHLADYFERRADAEGRNGEECRKLRKRFESALPSISSATGKGTDLLEHYDHLMQGHQRNAEDYRALAAWHRRLAKRAAGNDAVDQ